MRRPWWLKRMRNNFNLLRWPRDSQSNSMIRLCRKWRERRTTKRLHRLSLFDRKRIKKSLSLLIMKRWMLRRRLSFRRPKIL
jgi:hypothetical protein